MIFLYYIVNNQITDFIEDQLDLEGHNANHDDEIAIEKFYEMKNAAADTFTYTVFLFQGLITVFLLGLNPQHYYIVQTCVSSLVLAVQIMAYIYFTLIFRKQLFFYQSVSMFSNKLENITSS